jgi:hypothetical protein
MYRSDLLDISNRNWVVEFASLPEENFPAAAETGEFASKIDKLIKERKANEADTDELSAKIIPATTINDILDIIGNPDPKATNTDEFVETVKLPPSIKGIPPTPFPVAQPEPGPEEPVPPPPPNNTEKTEQPLDPTAPANDPFTQTPVQNDPAPEPAPPVQNDPAPDPPTPPTWNEPIGGGLQLVGQTYDPGPQMSNANLIYDNACQTLLSAQTVQNKISETSYLSPYSSVILNGYQKSRELIEQMKTNLSKMESLLAKAEELAENVDTSQSTAIRSMLESKINEISTLSSKNEEIYQELQAMCDEIISEAISYGFEE